MPYRKHRPLSDLNISILRGQNLIPHRGLPGSLVASVLWEPSKFEDDVSKQLISNIDPTSQGIFHICETESSGVTFSPEWKSIHESEELQRMKQLLPKKNFLSRVHSSDSLSLLNSLERKDDNVVHFPILQPIASSESFEEEDSDEDDKEDCGNISSKNVEILPWTASKGAITIEIRFVDVLNKLPIFDQVLGQVVIPISKIAEEGELEGWFNVVEKGSIEISKIIHMKRSEDNRKDDVEGTSFLSRFTTPDADPKNGREQSETKETIPLVYLRLKLTNPGSLSPNEIERETSIVVAEHFIACFQKKKEDNSISFLGSSISTFNTVTGVRGNVEDLQNQLGAVLDMLDIFCNAFNFTVS